MKHFFFYCAWWAWLSPWPFSLFLHPHICIVNLCAQWRPSNYSLYVPSAASRIQSGIDHIFIYLPGWNWNGSFTLLSIQPTFVLMDLLITSPCATPHFLLVVRTHFSYAYPYRLCFKNPQWKLPIKGQAKFGDLGDQHHPNILVPQ